jgi:hypothetical protein
MLERCRNPNSKIYKYYGGRGITFDERWSEFINFLGDVGYRPSLDHTLDRIDNEKGYYKDNVKWSTKTEQSNNRTNNIILDGVTLKQWCLQLGFRYKTVWRWFTMEGKDKDFILTRGEKLWGKGN